MTHTRFVDERLAIGHYGPDAERIARDIDLSRVTLPRDVPVVVEDGRTRAQ